MFGGGGPELEVELVSEVGEAVFGFVGGDFGGKSNLLDAPLCVLLAQQTKRPVKIVLSYAEELLSAARTGRL